MTPAQAQTADQYTVWANQFYSKPKPTREPTRPKQKKDAHKFSVGDRVKLSVLKKPFDREYDEKYTTETFTITNRGQQGDIDTYSVKDEQNEAITGWFYPQELLKVFVPNDKAYKIEKVLKRRKRNGREEMLVRWRGYSKKFDSWITDVDYL